MNVSIIIPCFNEKNTIEKILQKVEKNTTDNDEIIVVDDYSSDGTRDLLEGYKNKTKRYKVVFLEKNFGKGHALKTGIKFATKQIVLFQDADLEYDPCDYKKLLLPFVETNADVVYGSRFMGGAKYVRIHFFWHQLANNLLTFLTNMICNLNLTDMETGYKVFKKDALKQIEITQNSFGVEPEITIKLSKLNFKFFEVPISYNGRGYKEGKKIGLKDAFIAVYCIFKFGFFK